MLTGTRLARNSQIKWGESCHASTSNQMPWSTGTTTKHAKHEQESHSECTKFRHACCASETGYQPTEWQTTHRDACRPQTGQHVTTPKPTECGDCQHAHSSTTAHTRSEEGHAQSKRKQLWKWQTDGKLSCIFQKRGGHKPTQGQNPSTSIHPSRLLRKKAASTYHAARAKQLHVIGNKSPAGREQRREP